METIENTREQRGETSATRNGYVQHVRVCAHVSRVCTFLQIHGQTVQGRVSVVTRKPNGVEGMVPGSIHLQPTCIQLFDPVF
jgi:hypothetical protein